MLTFCSPLSTVGMPYYKEHLLSGWPSHMVFEVGAPPPKIDSTILNNMARTEMGYFAKNPRTKRRYQVEDTRQTDRSNDSLTAPKFLSEKARAAQSFSESDVKTTETMEALTDLHLDDVTRKDVPAMYGNVEIKYSKFGVDDFDFAYVLGPNSKVRQALTVNKLLQSNSILRVRNSHHQLLCKPAPATMPLYTIDTQSSAPTHSVHLSLRDMPALRAWVPHRHARKSCWAQLPGV
jgi:hypothetical protein